jgi:hypothetical protein
MKSEVSLVKTKTGISYYCYNDLIGFYLKNNIEDDYEINKITEFYLSDKKGTVIDVGANIGSYLIPLAKKFPNLFFKAFEVQKKIQETLLRNIKINNIKNCQTFNFGLSSIKKKKIISMPNYLTEKNIGGFSIDSLTRNNNYKVSDSLNKETLLLDRLDSSNFKKVILIKLDVEGHELDVLKGSRNTIIKNNYPLIIFEAFQRVEFKNKINKLFTFLKKFKYKIIRINSNCIAYAHDNYKMEFINAYIREVNLKNSFNPNQGIHYNSKQLYLACKRKFFG